MSLSIENLPVEVWHIIFSFIEAPDLERAFSHLNYFITDLLRSSNLRVCLNVKTGGCKELRISRISFCHEAIESLNGNIHGSSDVLIFLQTVGTLSNLRSLSLHIRRKTKLHLLASILPRLPCLEHLTVRCNIFNAGRGIELLYTEMLKLPQLRMCELRLSRDYFDMSDFNPILPISSSIRRFHIDAWVLSVDLCHLLKCMPSLRFLNAYLYHHNRSSWNDLSLPQLTKTACVSLINEHINLDSLAQAAPRLIYFRLQIEPYRGQFTREFLETYGFNNPEVKHVHVQMTLKKNINFAVIKFRFPEKILTNTITTAFGEIAYGQYECSLFDWHVIDDIKTTNNHTQWTHVHCGSFYIFHGEHVNKFVHLVCVPRNNSLREGIQAESITKQVLFHVHWIYQLIQTTILKSIFIYSAVGSHEIKIGECFRDVEHLEYILRYCLLVPEINTHLLERNIVLQSYSIGQYGSSGSSFGGLGSGRSSFSGLGSSGSSLGGLGSSGSSFGGLGSSRNTFGGLGSSGSSVGGLGSSGNAFGGLGRSSGTTFGGLGSSGNSIGGFGNSGSSFGGLGSSGSPFGGLGSSGSSFGSIGSGSSTFGDSRKGINSFGSLGGYGNPLGNVGNRIRTFGSLGGGGNSFGGLGIGRTAFGAPGQGWNSYPGLMQDKSVLSSGITSSQLKAIMPLNKHPEYLTHINNALVEGNINTPARKAAFLAQLAHESGQLRYMKEIASGEAYEGRKDLDNNQPGDGKLFKGRGPIQLTGRANYAAAGKDLGLDLVNNPELVETPEVGFRTSVWFWNKRQLNKLADRNTLKDFRNITKKINGGNNGSADREKYWKQASKVLKEQ
ncbi:unnamed protein product [Rotaria magnacalcarata]|uniref:chitinase n=1 Tax=Rotaria magnacalcarata TaxID=392030 RepID=A0A816Y303_9BILA|nr:unnamed protein product [Rotaria magnacalcarata]CAF3897488.1 unnamed protein product [Rotaria magnacalcarata]